MRYAFVVLSAILSVLIGVAVALVLLALLAAPVKAAPICGPADTILKTLAAKPYNEAPVARGITKAGAVLVLTVGEGANGPTWSLLYVYPDRHACLVITGTEWSVGTPPTGPAPDEGDPS